MKSLTKYPLLKEEVERTPEQEELEQMRDEEERQRTHEKWQEAVQQSFATYTKKMRSLAQRQQLITALRQVEKYLLLDWCWRNYFVDTENAAQKAAATLMRGFSLTI